MDENNHEETQERCKEALFVDDKSAELIQRVTSVMAIADELRTRDIIHGEKYEEIKAEKTDQEKMRRLFESLKSGGDDVKRDFYYLLEKHEPYLFKDLTGGVNRKRKLDEYPEEPVPSKRLGLINTGNNDYSNPNYNYYNKSSTSAPRQEPTYIVNHIINQSIPSYNLENFKIQNPIIRTSWIPAVKKEIYSHVPTKPKTPVPIKGMKPPTPKRQDLPAPKKQKPLAPKKQHPPPPKKQHPPPPKKQQPPPPKKQHPPPPKKQQPPPPKKQQPPPPKKQQPPPPKKQQPPPPKKQKPPPPKQQKPLAPKKQQPPAPKQQKPPAPKKQKPPPPKQQKHPATKKQKPPAPKK